MHCPVGQTTRRHPFIDRIMEVNIPLGWKTLNLERYDGTINLDKHLDAFLTQANLYTNTMQSCVVFSQRPSKGGY